MPALLLTRIFHEQVLGFKKFLHDSVVQSISFAGEHRVQAHRVFLPIMSSDSIDDVAPPETWPPVHMLASVWEENSFVRQSLRQNSKILRWPNVKTTGVATVENLRANRLVCQDALKVWASHSQQAKSPPVDWLREEACGICGMNSTGSLYT